MLELRILELHFDDRAVGSIPDFGTSREVTSRQRPHFAHSTTLSVIDCSLIVADSGSQGPLRFTLLNHIVHAGIRQGLSQVLGLE